MISFREISKENIDPILRLKVYDHQKDQVATNAESIAEGTYSDHAWFRAIYFNDTPVGFVMLYIDVKKKDFDVWRFMIDKEHQGKGYGKTSLLMAIDHFRSISEAEEIRLSYVPKENDGADGFYRKIGFVDTGEVDEGEIVMKYVISK